MKLLSVNVGLPKTVSHNGNIVATGIFKEPVDGRVMLRTLNLEGDGQADLTAHGGIYKAVYAYPYEHYATWQEQTGRDDFQYGQFGENLTTEGLTEETVHIGDVFQIGTAKVQVTQPRVPCFKLGIKMGDPTFPKRFLASQRSGFYLRVLEEGEVGAGDPMERLQIEPEQVTVRAINNLLFFEKDNVDLARRALQVEGLAPGWRESCEQIVADHG